MVVEACLTCWKREDVSMIYYVNTSGPSCSKLTTLLGNYSLKFQICILQIHFYFLLIKCDNPLQ